MTEPQGIELQDALALLRCCNTDCEELAVAIVFWPGQTSKMCLSHADWAYQVAKAMGFALPVTALTLAKARKLERNEPIEATIPTCRDSETGFNMPPLPRNP